jgi:2-methylfumaryl-CoA hydratase
MTSSAGNFFEDFHVGQVIRHATPRTVTAGDVALYHALYGTRTAVHSSDPFARDIGYRQAPVDDLLVFNIVFGKTVPDISLNAVANLGYAACRMLAPVYPGETLHAVSEVIGLRENSDRKAGVVYVRSTGLKHDGTEVVDYVRWVMVRKRTEESTLPEPFVPKLPSYLAADALGDAVPPLDIESYDFTLAGSPLRFENYEVGMQIDHVDGIAVEEAEHQIATRLYQNPARVHFDQHGESRNRYGRRLVYGGHVISLARALSFNGLANAFHFAGINSGRHVKPLFAGDTVFAWSQVADRQPIHGRRDVGALRLRTIATKDRACNDFPWKQGEDYDPAVILDLDYWVLIPR